MTQKPFIVFSFIAALIVGGLWLYCMPPLQSSHTLSVSATSTDASTLPKENLAQAIATALDEVMKQNPEFNQDALYLGIDTSSLISLDEEGKAALLTALEGYDLKVIDAPFDKLQQEGYIKDLIFTEGLFLQLEEEIISPTEIILYPSKWRSTTLHMGCSQMVLTYSGSLWQLSEVGTWWHM